MSEQNFSILGIDAHAMPPSEMPDPESFAAGLMDIIQNYENEQDGTMPPFTHVLAALMMEVFAPGFIIIGSPHTFHSHDGIGLPADVGILINANTDHTATTVGHFLGLLSNIIEESADSGLVDLTSLYGESND